MKRPRRYGDIRSLKAIGIYPGSDHLMVRIGDRIMYGYCPVCREKISEWADLTDWRPGDDMKIRCSAGHIVSDVDIIITERSNHETLE